MKLLSQAVVGFVIVVLATLCGGLWLIAPAGFRVALAARPAPPPIVSAPAAPITRAPSPEEQQAVAKLATVEEFLQKKQMELAGEDAQVAAQTQRLQDQLRRETTRSADLRTEIAILESKTTELQRLTPRISVAANAEGEELGAIEKLVRIQQNEVAKLESEAQQARNPAQEKLPPVPRAATAAKVPMLVELIHNRAVPLTRKYFHFPMVSLTKAVTVTRASPGEDAEEIAKPDSGFQKYLEKIKPEKYYLSCLLNNDSFAIFREVREIARKKGIAVGWEPIDSGEGKITVYPVRIMKAGQKQSEKMPRVAAILEE